MKKKDAFTGPGPEMFERVVMRGIIYIGRRKYFSRSLIPLSGKKVEIVRLWGDFGSVRVFFDKELVCVAAICDEGVNSFPSSPFVKGFLERAVYRQQRRFREVMNGGEHG